ncbi:iron sulfur assembly protein [Peziza echinospora]|nr:iron sulfur assembly protein [Peziza echinospora]
MLKPSSMPSPATLAGCLRPATAVARTTTRFRCLHTTPVSTSTSTSTPASSLSRPRRHHQHQLLQTIPRARIQDAVRLQKPATAILRHYTSAASPPTPTSQSPSSSNSTSNSNSNATTTTSFTPTPSTLQTPLKVTNPKTDADGNAMRVHITPRAVQRLHHLQTTSANPSLALRISVEAGGCHGFQYLISLDENPPLTFPENEEDADTVFDQDGARVIIDGPSLELLNGASVDFTTELIGRQFKVVGIPGAGSSCGCGTSFDIKI